MESAAGGALQPERDRLTGLWGGLARYASEHGLRPYLNYAGLLWSNVDGGRERGTVVDGYLNWGIDAHLAKMGTWQGLSARIGFHWWQGREPTKALIGGLLAQALSGWEAAATVRVYDIYLQQSLENGRWLIKLGQIAADTDFMVSRYAGVFLNAAFGDLPSENLNFEAPVYPLAAPGIFFSGSPWPWLAGRIGAYTGNAGEDVAGNHGLGWKLGNDAGYLFFFEFGTSRPGNLRDGYTIGAIFDTGGSNQPTTAEDRPAHHEFYGIIDRVLVSNYQGDPILGAFARMSGGGGGRESVVGMYADAGIALSGPLTSRPNDVLGFAVSILRFTHSYRQQQKKTATPVGGGETLFEATYQFAISPWLALQPDVQYFLNPSSSRSDALALGCQVVAIF